MPISLTNERIDLLLEGQSMLMPTERAEPAGQLSGRLHSQPASVPPPPLTMSQPIKRLTAASCHTS